MFIEIDKLGGINKIGDIIMGIEILGMNIIVNGGNMGERVVGWCLSFGEIVRRDLVSKIEKSY